MFKLDTSQWDKLQKQFEEMSDRQDEGINKLKEKLQQIVFDDISQRFRDAPPVETGGVVWGELAYINGEVVSNVTWDKMADFWLESHPNRRGGQLLIDTGRLRDAATGVSGEAMVQVDGNSLSVEVQVPYAKKVGSRRPFIFMHQTLAEKLSKTITYYFMTGDVADDAETLLEYTLS